MNKGTGHTHCTMYGIRQPSIRDGYLRTYSNCLRLPVTRERPQHRVLDLDVRWQIGVKPRDLPIPQQQFTIISAILCLSTHHMM